MLSEISAGVGATFVSNYIYIYIISSIVLFLHVGVCQRLKSFRMCSCSCDCDFCFALISSSYTTHANEQNESLAMCSSLYNFSHEASWWHSPSIRRVQWCACAKKLPIVFFFFFFNILCVKNSLQNPLSVNHCYILSHKCDIDFGAACINC